jgi:hypothetical protein
MVVKVAARVAVPNAAEVLLAAVPLTGAVPRIVLAELKVTVPMGPTPELEVLTVALKAIGEFVDALGRGDMAMVVAALVMEMVFAAEVLES